MKFIRIDKDYSLDEEFELVLKFLDSQDNSHPTRLSTVHQNAKELSDAAYYNALGQYCADVDLGKYT